MPSPSALAFSSSLLFLFLVAVLCVKVPALKYSLFRVCHYFDFWPMLTWHYVCVVLMRSHLGRCLKSLLWLRLFQWLHSWLWVGFCFFWQWNQNSPFCVCVGVCVFLWVYVWMSVGAHVCEGRQNPLWSCVSVHMCVSERVCACLISPLCLHYVLGWQELSRTKAQSLGAARARH